jgi:hypothetical protein
MAHQVRQRHLQPPDDLDAGTNFGLVIYFQILKEFHPAGLQIGGGTVAGTCGVGEIITPNT